MGNFPPFLYVAFTSELFHFMIFLFLVVAFSFSFSYWILPLNFFSWGFVFFFFMVWLCWVSFAFARGFSSCGKWGCPSLLPGPGFSLQWLLLLWSVISGPQASVAAGGRLHSCGSWAELLCGTWDLPRPGTGLDWCALHWQVGSYPLYHKGNPLLSFLIIFTIFSMNFFLVRLPIFS